MGLEPLFPHTDKVQAIVDPKWHHIGPYQSNCHRSYINQVSCIVPLIALSFLSAMSSPTTIPMISLSIPSRFQSVSLIPVAVPPPPVPPILPGLQPPHQSPRLPSIISHPLA